MAHLVLCPRDSDAQRGSAQSPHGVGWDGGVPRRHAAGLGFAASGVSGACACVPPQPGGAGGGPIRAPRQSLPLPLVTAASLLCLAWVQPPHTSPLPGSHPAPPSQYPNIHVTWVRASPLQASVSSSGNGGYWSFCSSPDPLRTTRQHAVAACLPSMQLCTGSCVPSPDVTWAPAGLCI